MTDGAAGRPRRPLLRERWSLVDGDYGGLGLFFFELHLTAYAFYFAKYSQQVSAEDFLDVFGGVATVEEGLGDFGEVGGGVDARGVAPLTPSKSEPKPT